MFARSDYLDNIIQHLAVLTTMVQGAQAHDQSDLIAVTENVVSGILNQTYGYHLVPTDDKPSQMAGIDLLDPQHAVAVAITTISTRQKISNTISGFCEGAPGSRLCDRFRTLIYFILANGTAPRTLPDYTGFDLQVLTISELVSLISTLPLDTVKSISDMLDKELGVIPGEDPLDIIEELSPVLPITYDLSGFSDLQKQVLYCAALLPETGFYRKLFLQCLPEDRQRAAHQLIRDKHLIVLDNLICLAPALRGSCCEVLSRNEADCLDFLDRLWKFDRTHFWRHLPLMLRSDIYLQLAQTFSQAAGMLSDPFGSLALRSASFYEEINRPGTELNWTLHAVHACESSPLRDPWSLAYAFQRTGACYLRQGDGTNALKYFAKVRDLCRNEIRVSDPDLARLFHSIGRSQMVIPEYPAAVDSLLQALSHAENILSRDHPLLEQINSDLSLAYNELGIVEKTREYKLKSVRIRAQRRSEPTESAVLAAKLKQLAKAESLPALFQGKKVPTLCTEIGSLYAAQGDHAMALEFRMRALEYWEAHSKSDPLQLAAAYHAVGTTFADIGDNDSALEYQKTALTLRTDTPGTPAEDLIRSYIDLGETCADMQSPEDALDYFQQALALQRSARSSYPLEQAATQVSLGHIYRALNKHPESRSHYDQALALRQNTLPKDHPDIAASLMDVTNACIQSGKYKPALHYARQALDIYRKIRPAGHPQLITAQKNVAWLENLT